MPSLKSYRTRITSVKSTQKITKALQMVASAKLKRAQDAAEAARPYGQRVAATIGNLAGAAAGSDSAPLLLRGTGKTDTHVVVVATAERGLCGGFNTNIVKKARETIKNLVDQGRKVSVITIGKKGRDQLRRQFGELMIKHFDFSSVRQIGGTQSSEVSSYLLASFENGDFDVAHLVYARFQSVIAQVPTLSQLIPVVVPESVGQTGVSGAYEYEPSEEAVLTALLPRYLDSQILGALLENGAGFFGAQMGAMDNATRNAGDMIKKLTLQMNRKRQAMITTELTEIIAGAQAV